MIYTNDIIKSKNERKKKIRKIVELILLPIIIIIILFSLYICYEKFVKKENDVDIFGIRQYVIMTGSMKPDYDIGDIIIDKTIEKKDIKINDVITFMPKNASHTVSHRIIDIKEEDGVTYYQTKGDNNNAPDLELITYDQVIGKVVYKISKAGLAIKLITTGTGIIYLIVIIIVIYIHSMCKDKKRMKRERIRKIYNKPKYKNIDGETEE